MKSITTLIKRANAGDENLSHAMWDGQATGAQTACDEVNRRMSAAAASVAAAIKACRYPHAAAERFGDAAQKYDSREGLIYDPSYNDEMFGFEHTGCADRLFKAQARECWREVWGKYIAYLEMKIRRAGRLTGVYAPITAILEEQRKNAVNTTRPF